MIGKVIFGFRQGQAEAVLHDDGHWSCPALPCLVRPLEIRYSPLWNGSNAIASSGRLCLEEVACWLNGCVVWVPSIETESAASLNGTSGPASGHKSCLEARPIPC